MNQLDEKIAEVRKRVIESERRELMKVAEKKFPGDKQRQEKYVFKALSAKYDFRKNQESLEIPPYPPSKGGIGLEEVLNLPLKGCEISFAIGSMSFLEGDCLVDIIKRDVGAFVR